MSLASDPQERWECARKVLAEIEAYPNELRAFVSDTFDQLSHWTSELLVQELARQRGDKQAETDALKNQLHQLSAIVAQLVGSNKKDEVPENA